MNAPTNSPPRYSGTSPQSVLPSSANPSVTAGFRCAPLNCPTANTAIATAMPHPNVMTIQPPFCALECASRTAATTPSPSRIRIAVPITSAPKMLKCPPPSRETLFGRAPYVASRRGSMAGGAATSPSGRRERALDGRLGSARRGAAVRLGLEERLHARHDLSAWLVGPGPDRGPEVDLDAVTPREEAALQALGPVAAGRHRLVRALHEDGDDRDVVLLGDHRRARAHLPEPAVPRPGALGEHEQVPALVDQAVDVGHRPVAEPAAAALERHGIEDQRDGLGDQAALVEVVGGGSD